MGEFNQSAESQDAPAQDVVAPTPDVAVTESVESAQDHYLGISVNTADMVQGNLLPGVGLNGGEKSQTSSVASGAKSGTGFARRTGEAMQDRLIGGADHSERTSLPSAQMARALQNTIDRARAYRQHQPRFIR